MDRVAQQTAQPRAGLGQLLGVGGRDRVPREVVVDQREQLGRSRKACPRRLDVACQRDDLALQRPVAPQREGLSVRVEEVRQGLQLVPLRLVVALELARIGPLGRRLQLDMADQRAVHVDGVVRPRLQRRHPRLADERDRTRGLSRLDREPAQKLLERRAQLVLGIPARRHAPQLRLQRRAEVGDRLVHHQPLPPLAIRAEQNSSSGTEATWKRESACRRPPPAGIVQPGFREPTPPTFMDPYRISGGATASSQAAMPISFNRMRCARL